MLRKLISIFRTPKPPPLPPRASSDLVTFSKGVYEATAGNDDIIGGYVFSATLDPRTPASVLRRHGMVVAKLPPEHLRTHGRDGIWMPKLKSWQELGLKIKELAPSQIASAVGLVPEDGGDFLPFLIAFREAIETGGNPVEVAERAWKRTQTRTEWREFAKLLGWTGPDSLDEYVGYPAAVGVPSLSIALAKKLYHAGYTSRTAVEAASDEAIRSIKGIGPKKLLEIRRAVAHG